MSGDTVSLYIDEELIEFYEEVAEQKDVKPSEAFISGLEFARDYAVENGSDIHVEAERRILERRLEQLDE